VNQLVVRTLAAAYGRKMLAFDACHFEAGAVAGVAFPHRLVDARRLNLLARFVSFDPITGYKLTSAVVAAILSNRRARPNTGGFALHKSLISALALTSALAAPAVAFAHRTGLSNRV
jgi:hypothetical protein